MISRLARDRWACIGIGGGAGVAIFVGLVATASALFELRGPSVLYQPAGLPNLLLRVAGTPAELALAICPWVGNMFLYPAAAFLGWAALGMAAGEVVWRIARWTVGRPWKHRGGRSSEVTAP